MARFSKHWGLTVHDLARELGVSKRTAYRIKALEAEDDSW